MKTLHRLLKEYFLLQRFQIHAFMLLLMFSLSSCFQKFYKTNTVSTTDSATLQKLVDENKTFIIHTPEEVVSFRNATVSFDVFSGDKDVLTPANEKHLNSLPESPNHLKKKESKVVLKEVHLYTRSTFPANGKMNLDINKIYRIDVYGLDKKATRDSRILSIAGIGIGVGVIVGITVAVAYGMSHMFENTTFNFH